MAFLTTKTLPGPIQAWYDDNLLASSIAANIYSIPAMKKRLPTKSSKTLRVRGRNRILVNKVPLSENGTPVPPSIYSNTDIDATISWYGQWIGINEQVEITSQDRVLNGATIELGVTMRVMEDELIRDMLISSAAAVNCTGGAGGDSPTGITIKDFRAVSQSLMSSNAFTALAGQDASNAVGTGAIPNSYFALAHTDLASDLANEGKFRPTHEYPVPSKALPSEWGTIDRFRVLLSTNAAMKPNYSAKDKDVYFISCVGMDAYATVNLDNNSAAFLYKGPEYSDALMQNSSAGFKIAFCPTILNEEWVINLRATKIV